MKFSTIFTSLVATLAASVVANPIPAAIESGLEVRAPPAAQVTESAEYQAVKKANSNLVAGKDYYFTLKWNLRDDADKDQSDVGKLRQEIGAFHVAVLVGTVKETITQKGTAKKPQITKKDFEGKIYHMIKPTAGSQAVKQEVEGFKVSGINAKFMDGKSIEGGQQTSKNRPSTLKTWGDNYVNGKTYDVKTNNCQTFANAFKGQL